MPEYTWGVEWTLHTDTATYSLIHVLFGDFDASFRSGLLSYRPTVLHYSTTGLYYLT